MNTPNTTPVNTLDFAKYPENLMPTIAQDADTGEILMVGFANPLALETTRQTGYATFWSRSRNELWTKWLTSWDTLEIRDIYTDCDNDTLVYLVKMNGKWACHIDGWKTCFRRRIDTLTGLIEDAPSDLPRWSRVNQDEQRIIEARATASPDDSFTAKLAQWSWGKLTGKLAEETFETVQALLGNEWRDRIISELADMDYVKQIIIAKINISLRDQWANPISTEEIDSEIISRRK
jgi:phosphoribosyl-ATP pyrophosphohydrolase